MKNKDSLGDRMKGNYEVRTRYVLPRRTHTAIRIDDKAFHTFTRGFARPFDDQLIMLMDETTKYLCEHVQGCKLGYVQSDEISLILTDFDQLDTQAWFDGNIQKISSISASLATGIFNNLLGKLNLPFTVNRIANFDSRVFTIPELNEVKNYLIWRQQDATRNSISMVAQSLYSQKELHGKNCNEMQELSFQKGTNWNDLSARKKRGGLIVKGENGWNAVDCPVFTGEGWNWLDQFLVPKVENES